jgi:tetratricopeptide (TPR) repeat protein
MTEESELGEAPEAPEATEPLNPAAVSIALERRVSAGTSAVDTEAAAFLRDQRRLINLQAEHLHEQRELQLAHLRVRRWKDRMSLSLQVLAAAAGAVIAFAFIVMAWNAHEDHGLVIDAFSVPSEFAAEGLSGGVVAQLFLDKLNALQLATESDRPAETFQNNWGEDIKVEIPETGVKLGDVKKFLRDQLGDVSHVTGEAYKTAAGVAIAARLGDTPPQTFEGSRSEIDSLVQKAAESVYRFSQPYRFSVYLEQHGRVEEAMAVISDLATNGPASERGWAYSEWAHFNLNDFSDAKAARAHAKQGLGFTQGSTVRADIELVGEEVWSGHDEQALEYSKDLDSKAHARSPETTQSYFEQNSLVSTAWLSSLVGDLKTSGTQWLRVAKTPEFLGLARLSHALAATEFALDHDLEAARDALGPLGAIDDASFLEADAINAFMGLPDYWLGVERGDWHAALEDARAADAWLEGHKAKLSVAGLMQSVWIHPLQALAMAKVGDAAGSLALIETTPTDCYLCLRVRGRIAAQMHDWPAAERWFGEAARQAPSMPFAFAEWGEERLARGDADGAISVLERAHETGPLFADALELMGEALLRKGDYRGAADKFRSADEAAPHWGRNHLRWGESLLRVGREREAKAQLQTARRLNLDVSDRAELDALLAPAAAAVSEPIHQ